MDGFKLRKTIEEILIKTANTNDTDVHIVNHFLIDLMKAINALHLQYKPAGEGLFNIILNTTKHLQVA
ncbi:unnamed protein product [Cunninghamella echinulata]